MTKADADDDGGTDMRIRAKPECSEVPSAELIRGLIGAQTVSDAVAHGAASIKPGRHELQATHLAEVTLVQGAAGYWPETQGRHAEVIFLDCCTGLVARKLDKPKEVGAIVCVDVCCDDTGDKEIVCKSLDEVADTIKPELSAVAMLIDI